MSASDDPVAWLRQLLERCLEHHRQVAGSNDAGEQTARCEAELAILDEHHYMNLGDCGRCRGYGPHSLFMPYPCTTVRLLASGYKHRPGYREEDWKR